MSEPGGGQRFAQRVERKEAAARGAVMAGAEGERGLDLDADPVRRHTPAIMRAVHDEAAGGDRLEPGDAFAHPILRRHAREAQRMRRLAPGRRRDQRAHRVFVGRCAEVDGDLPASAARVGEAHRGVVHRLAAAEGIGDPPGALFIGFEARHRGGGRRGIHWFAGCIPTFARNSHWHTRRASGDSGRLMSTTPSSGFPQIINDSRTGFSQETNCLVMLGLVPGVHVFRRRRLKDVDDRDEPGHDGLVKL